MSNTKFTESDVPVFNALLNDAGYRYGRRGCYEARAFLDHNTYTRPGEPKVWRLEVSYTFRLTDHDLRDCDGDRWFFGGGAWLVELTAEGLRAAEKRALEGALKDARELLSELSALIDEHTP